MAHFATTSQLTLEGAKAIGAAAEAMAVKNGWTICVAVVDAGGHPLYLARMDGALLASYRGALQKATTSLQFGRSTQRLDDDVAGGRPHVLGFSEVLPVVGGIPIEMNGQVIGGIGIGGTTTGPAATLCAEAGLAALKIPSAT